MSVPRRYAFVIGAMKSGTTSLYHALAGHPQVCPCRIGELCYFVDPEVYRKGDEWYCGLWAFDPDVHRVALEHSGNYTKDPLWPTPAERIHTFAAAAKLIYIVRDPLERIESHYNAGLKLGWFGFERKITEELFLVPTRYAHQLRCYERYFPSNAIFVCRSQDLRGDPRGLLRRLSEFLDIDRRVDLDASQHNPTETLTRTEAFVKRTRLERWKARAPRAVKRIAKKLLTERPASKRRLTERERSFITEALSKDIQDFVARYGVEPRNQPERWP